MKELSGNDRITEVRTSVALGIFDGVHRGHRAVVGYAAKSAKASEFASAVCTFRTATVNTKGADYRPIYSDNAKFDIIEELGIDFIFAPDFSEIRGLSPEEFVSSVLIEKMNAAELVCGRDFHFGRNAACDVNGLADICSSKGIGLKVIDDVSDSGVRISSAQIRNMIADGDIVSANRFLGHDYAVIGEVIEGNHIGRQIDFPTANQAMNESFVLPKFGVYASYAEIDGTIYRGVTNVGVKPTVETKHIPLAETHFPSFDGDLYGRKLAVHLVDFIRPEQRFESLEALRGRIEKDTQTVRSYNYKINAL